MTTPRHAWVWWILGLVATSQSGNIIRLGHASPAAITAWRLAFAVLLLVPFAWPGLGQLRRLKPRHWALLGLAGAGLATHWFAWIAAVQQGTVANAAVFFSVNPVVIATAGFLFFGERVGLRLWLSIGLGITGVVVIGGADLRFSPGVVTGDLYGLLSAVLFAVYFLSGKVLRQHLDGGVYVWLLYGIAGVVAFAVLLATGHPVVSYDSQTWLTFALMAGVPTLLGHTGLNIALRYFPVSRISVSTLSEPILAGLVAWMVWSEPLTPQTAIGYVLISLSVVFLVLANGNGARRQTSDEPG